MKIKMGDKEYFVESENVPDIVYMKISPHTPPLMPYAIHHYNQLGS